MTPDDVGKRSEQIARNEREHDRIWNAAIEAVITKFKNSWVAPDTIIEFIKELKK